MKKTKKQFAFIVIGILISRFCQAKEQYASIHPASSQKTIEQIEDKYKGKDYEVLIYGKNAEGKYHGEVMVVSSGGTASYWCLKSDSVTATGTLDSDQLFKYGGIKNTGVRKEEEYPAGTFIPPIYKGVDNEYVIFKNKISEFYFCYGKYNIFYKSDLKSDKFRREWIELIRTQLDALFVG